MEEYKEKIKKYFELGYPISLIAKKLNKSDRTIRFHIKNMGLKVNKFDWVLFEKLLLDNKSDVEIAEVLNRSIATIKSNRSKIK